MSASPKSIFITGDLGYDALENIRLIAKKRFINAGVAEQNMIGVAAGLAYKGYETFVYSIAPFAVYRCLEQIKIDVCIHNLPVYIVGNGGGYGYGIMGATHHAIEDIACLSALPDMTCWVPAFKEDIDYCVNQITAQKKPAYLRLGLGKPYLSNIKISHINQIIKGKTPKITVIALGPVVHNAIEAIDNNEHIDLFTILSVPLIELSETLANSVLQTNKVIVIEEHVERGGLSEHLLSVFAKQTIKNIDFKSIHAMGYPDKLYGNQAFHQKESGLDAKNIRKEINKLLQL